MRFYAEPVLTSTHNLCCGSKIRKIGIPCRPQFLLYVKVGFKGVYTLHGFRDGIQYTVFVMVYKTGYSRQHSTIHVQFSAEPPRSGRRFYAEVVRGSNSRRF